ncbi:MAG: SDR family NAD(P)-dependent oxidoreductase [Firmicutes bacterium]|nr:SDR family NAD(P)-dependent oxidoreductase [Bacillota bacterium]
MTNKTVVITGTTDGIGLATVRDLLLEGATVIAVARNKKKAARVAKELNNDRLTFVFGDLSLQSEVVKIADQIKTLLDERHVALHVLIHVAGAVSSKRVLTSEGIEWQFAVNHLAPFLLTKLLMPYLLQEKGARVLVVSSGAHRVGRVHFQNIMFKHGYFLITVYAQSKLMNVLFVKESASRIDPSLISFYALDPGLVKTGLGVKKTFGLEKWAWEYQVKKGVDPSVPAHYFTGIALDPSYALKSGLYWKNGVEVKPSKRAENKKDAKRLYELTDKLCETK